MVFDYERTSRGFLTVPAGVVLCIPLLLCLVSLACFLTSFAYAPRSWSMLEGRYNMRKRAGKQHSVLPLTRRILVKSSISVLEVIETTRSDSEKYLSLHLTRSCSSANVFKWTRGMVIMSGAVVSIQERPGVRVIRIRRPSEVALGVHRTSKPFITQRITTRAGTRTCAAPPNGRVTQPKGPAACRFAIAAGKPASVVRRWSTPPTSTALFFVTVSGYGPLARAAFLSPRYGIPRGLAPSDHFSRLRGSRWWPATSLVPLRHVGRRGSIPRQYKIMVVAPRSLTVQVWIPNILRVTSAALRHLASLVHSARVTHEDPDVQAGGSGSALAFTGDMRASSIIVPILLWAISRGARFCISPFSRSFAVLGLTVYRRVASGTTYSVITVQTWQRRGDSRIVADTIVLYFGCAADDASLQDGCGLLENCDYVDVVEYRTTDSANALIDEAEPRPKKPRRRAGRKITERRIRERAERLLAEAAVSAAHEVMDNSDDGSSSAVVLRTQQMVDAGMKVEQQFVGFNLKSEPDSTALKRLPSGGRRRTRQLQRQVEGRVAATVVVAAAAAGDLL